MCRKSKSAEQASETDTAKTARLAARLIRRSAEEHVRGNEGLSAAYKAVARAEIDEVIRPSH